MSTFVYSPLESLDNYIRLLELHPGSSDDNSQPVSCTLKNYPLAESPPYLALSYTWGSASLTKPMLVNNILVPITTNLELALRDLRHEKTLVVLWADAVCINQKDNEEKSHQVQIMKKIFQTAVTVIGWLGPPTHNCNIALPKLSQIGKTFEGLGGVEVRRRINRSIRQGDLEGWALATKELDYIHAQLESIFNGSGSFPRDAFNDLNSREYWTRIWILQEVCVAKELEFICGRYRIRSSHLFAVFSFYWPQVVRILAKQRTILEAKKPINLTLSDFEQSMIPQPPLSVCTLSSVLAAARQKFQSDHQEAGETLMHLVARANVQLDPSPRMEATDSRDRIFGLLALANDSHNLNIMPDYTKSYEEVFIEVAKSWLTSGHIEILAFCQFPKGECSLPTWVPDWKSVIRTPCGWYKEDLVFSAAGKTQQRADLELSDPNIIRIRGTVIDIVERVGTAWHPEKEQFTVEDYEGAGIFFAEVEDFANKSSMKRGNIYQTAAQLEELLWRVPIADQEMDGPKPNGRATPISRQGYEDVKRGIKLGFDEQIKYSDAKSSFMNRMSRCRNRRPFLSKLGYVGLVPAHSQEGDMICILLGAYVPFAMRKYGDRKPMELVGEGYVHGVMDGEFMETDPNIETFSLR